MNPSAEEQNSSLALPAINVIANMNSNAEAGDSCKIESMPGSFRSFTVCIPYEATNEKNIASAEGLTSSKEDCFVHHPFDGKELTLPADEKQVVIYGESNTNQGTSTYFHATINCVSLLLGLGILSSPYAVAKSGWIAVIISIVLAFSYWYTASLMVHCLKVHPHVANYQGIASLAFGRKGRLLIVTLFYIEIMGTLVGYSISMGDNLFYIFPNLKLSIPGLSGKNLMIFITSVCVLPTVWLRDLSALSFTAIWCIVSSAVLLVAVFLAAIGDGIGFKYPVPFLRMDGVPVAAGLYAFAYGGTGVFPTVYRSMKDPSTFPKVSVVSFIIATAAQAGLGIAGGAMFGHEHTKSQITLSMPTHLVATKIVLWMTVVTPMTKFALLLSPVTNELERMLPLGEKASPQLRHAMGTLARSMVLGFITIVAMTLPYFEYILALIGSSMTITICMILPGIYYLKIFRGHLKRRTLITTVVLVAVGVMSGIAGTIISFKGLIDSKHSTNTDN